LVRRNHLTEYSLVRRHRGHWYWPARRSGFSVKN
jgi:hypothetical protein